MKNICTLLTLLLLAITSNITAQTTYAVNSSSSYPANCTNCTFNIASGATLTISQSGTCSNCTFNGGTVAIANSITCQPCSFSGNTITLTNTSINPNSNTTSFNNVILTANGTSSISANTPVTISNSTFTFNTSSFFNNNGGQLDISNSTLNFNGNSYFNANAGPVNLKNSSKLNIGSGLLGSLAYIKINGPVLNIYDNTSNIVLANYNNYYFNWSTFNSVGNSKSYTTTYPSAASTLNCGAPGENACAMWSAPTVFGPSMFSYAGVNSIAALLPVVLTNFSASNAGNNVLLQWTTSQEINTASFDIERSTDGATWAQIATVAANGNTNTISHYNFTDATPSNGVVYYRLAIVDQDGKKSYSNTKTVHAVLTTAIHFYPNPAVNNIQVSLPGTSEVTVQLASTSGQVLQERKAAIGTTKISFDVQQYPRGMYMITALTADAATQTTKLMIAH